VSPQEVLYIDDIPEYVEAAKSFGINGLVFENGRMLQKLIVHYCQ